MQMLRQYMGITMIRMVSIMDVEAGVGMEMETEIVMAMGMGMEIRVVLIKIMEEGRTMAQEEEVQNLPQ